ncbi:NADPH-dependent oxidoreductase [Lactobacillus sp. DCY120]|uniref:NADPH-dependent oxidoreductase n=1 Tax=Bombilactobacillus apium TaxID=2675299 RepID=A0A850R2J9_9LACO|nr:NADPH-dependent oxidoreductase [Bombilactobacillus apium]NVY97143.1 NADPH-dependent oxidoreductase [Bombilactobacillus apium]
MNNQVLDLLLKRRTIRAFKDQTLTPEQYQTLTEVVRQTATSMFMQQTSLIHVTDPEIRTTIREVCNQPYVGANGDLFVFVVDLYRNRQILATQGLATEQMHGTDVFLQAVEDTVLAAQNFTTAAESLGLGAVFLGSIQNDAQKVVTALQLPELTFPLLGLQVGIPDQKPQLKPRMPLSLRTFTNHYQPDYQLADFGEYDQVVQTYYDLRDANRRVDSFTHQVGTNLTKSPAQRRHILDILHAQKLCLH